MTPKEKATQLCNDLQSFSFYHVGSNSMNRQIEREGNAKQIAYLLINEILNLDYSFIECREYWSNVKDEIDLLYK